MVATATNKLPLIAKDHVLLNKNLFVSKSQAKEIAMDERRDLTDTTPTSLMISPPSPMVLGGFVSNGQILMEHF